MLISRNYTKMNLEIGLLIGAALVILFLGIRYGIIQKEIQELKSKTDFALEGKRLMKITFKEESTLGKIAANFNTLIQKYFQLEDENTALEEHRSDKFKLSDKVEKFEESLTQITVLTDIGKKITANLTIDNIVETVHNSLKSTMHVDELELLYYKHDKPILVHVDNLNQVTENEAMFNENTHQIMHWAIDNKKEVVLNNAKEDYQQYVYNEIKSISGNDIGSIICIPLFMHNKNVGAIAVSSSTVNVYNHYHVDFIRTIGSYMAVALDNSNVYEQLNSNKNIIEKEKTKSDNLLLNILPAEIAEELKQKGEAEAKSFDNVSVLFTDFKQFTKTSEQLTARELVSELNHCFKAFDEICEKHEIEKIKTIGDSFMAAGGIPIPSTDSVKNTVLAGIAMADFISHRIAERQKENKLPFSMRVGIHTGPVVAGIVGVKKFQYDIWGDTVNLASRMESNGTEGMVNISQKTYDLLKTDNNFKFEHRGKVEAKGKGEIDMYYVKLA